MVIALSSFVGMVAASAVALEVTPMRCEHIVLTAHGVAAVTERVELGGRSEVHVTIDPQVVPESLSFSGHAFQSVTRSMQSVAVSSPANVEGGIGSLQEALAGQGVTLFFSKLQEPPLKGRLVDWDFSLLEGEKVFVLQEGKNIRYVDPDAVEMVQFSALSAEQPFIRKLPVLHFQFGEIAREGSEMRLHYLTRALESSLHYTVTLLEGARLSIQPYVTVKNKLGELSLVEMEYYFGDPVLDMDGASGGGEPLQALWLGTFTLPYGGELSIPLETRESAATRVMHGMIANNRSLTGALLGAKASERTGLFHAVDARNPYGFPLAEARASVMEAGRFRALSSLPDAEPSGRFILDIEPAQGAFMEHEEEIQSTNNGLTTLRGTIRLINARNMPADFVIDRTLTGKVLDADGQPFILETQTNASEPNGTQRLRWETSLAPNEEITLSYRYQLRLQP